MKDRVELARFEDAACYHHNPNRSSLPEMRDAIDDAHKTYSDTQLNPDVALVPDLFAEFMRWVINPHPMGKGTLNPKAVAQRAIMATWILRPEYVKGRTMTSLAVLLETSPEVLSRQASSFTKRFGIKGRCQYAKRARSKAILDIRHAQRTAKVASNEIDPSRN